MGIPGCRWPRTFSISSQNGYAFITQGEELVEGEDGRIVLSDIQRKAGKFLANLLSSEVSFTGEVPMSLAYELLDLGLSRDELDKVLKDLIDGPLLDSPDSQPPAEDPSSSADLQTLSFLLNHQFSGTIDPNLIVSADVAMASPF